MRSKFKTVIFLILVISFQAELICKECFLCKKIEAERALEQASNPQEAGYYDDYISMLEEERLKSSKETPEEEKDNQPDQTMNKSTKSS